jgi:endoglucanase
MFKDDFEIIVYSESCWSPRGNYSFADGRTGQGIRIESTSSAGKKVETSIPVECIKGGLVQLAGWIRAENVTQPPNPWNGVKLMLRINPSDGTTEWPQQNMEAGTFDWTYSSRPVSIPATAVKVTLILGLEECAGVVWFDDVLIRFLKSAASYPAPRDPSTPIDKCHDVPALRGAMVSTWMNQDDGRVLSQEWKANLIRWQVGGWDPQRGLLMPNYDSILEDELKRLDQALTGCRGCGLKVLVDLHSLSQGLFQSVEAENKLVDVWKKIAARYKGNPCVWAYDLANEPEFYQRWNTFGVPIWEDLAEKIVAEIRFIDQDMPIVIESYSGVPSTIRDLRPLPFSVPHIIYSYHMYEPHAFTDQTLYGYNQPYVYPGAIEGKMWDKNQLVNVFEPVKEFQDKHRVPILVGEFSAIRWAPSNSAYPYLRDCIEIFESYGWDWCYHAFREWDGWSVEHSEDMNDPVPTPTPNERQLLLRSYYSQNLDPYT